MIKAIVCVDKTWGIGKNNGLLFQSKKDMEFFKSQTSGKIVVCGYNTLLSFPKQKPLKNRSTFVLAPEGVERTDCVVLHSFDAMLKVVSELAKTQEVFVIGGAMFYKSMLDYSDSALVTKVDADGGARVFFEDLDANPDWIKVSESDPVLDEGLTLSFCEYKNNNKKIYGE